MKIQNKSSKKSVIIASVAMIVVICAGIAGYVWLSKSNSHESIQENTAQKSSESTDKNQKSTDNSTKSSSTDSLSTHEKEKNITPEYEGEDANANPSITGVINYSSVVGENLVIRTTINQSLGSGSCEITLSNGTKTIAKTSNIAQNPSSSACEGFDIATSELGNGTWNINIKVTGDGKTGTLTGSVQI